MNLHVLHAYFLRGQQFLENLCNDSYFLIKYYLHIQICLGSAKFRGENVTKERIRDAIHGVSEQFVDDFMFMYETYRNDPRTNILTALVSEFSIQ